MAVATDGIYSFGVSVVLRFFCTGSGQNNACLKGEFTLVLMMSKDLDAVTKLSLFEASIAFN